MSDSAKTAERTRQELRSVELAIADLEKRRAKLTAELNSSAPEPARERYEFLWTNEDDQYDWDRTRHRVYVGGLVRACNRMVKFLESRQDGAVVDYEAQALHVEYDPRQHEARYPNLYEMNHPIKDYIG